MSNCFVQQRLQALQCMFCTCDEPQMGRSLQSLPETREMHAICEFASSSEWFKRKTAVPSRRIDKRWDPASCVTNSTACCKENPCRDETFRFDKGLYPLAGV